MIQLSYIRSAPEEVIARLGIRGIDAAELVNKIIDTDREARSKRSEMEQLQARGNALAKQVGDLMRSGKADEANAIKQETGLIKETLKQLETRVAELEAEVRELIVSLPNTPNESVPTGKTADDNKTILEWGSKPNLSENALPHWELAAKYDIIDFELGVKITGAGFPVYKGKGATLQRALINFFLTEAIKSGYTEVQPPILVNADSGFGTGQLPDKEGQMYFVPEDGLYLIPTAEVPITNFYREVILEENQLPVKNAGYTPCFRREAGSYGAHVRGLNRLHQFDKVEIVQVVKPETSYQVLEEMSLHVQGLLQKLGLHYRVLLLCGGLEGERRQ